MDKLQEVKEYFERLIEIYAEELTLKSNVKWLIEQVEKQQKEIEQLRKFIETPRIETDKNWRL